MKLLLGGLLVFAGLLVAAALVGEDIETMHPAAAGAVLAAGFLVPAALAWRFLRGGDDELRLERRVGDLCARVRRGAGLRPSAMDHRVEYVAGAMDLLRAERARRRRASGMRPWVRGCVLAMGFAWLAGFFLTLPDAPQDPPPTWAWLVLGSGVVGVFLALPLAREVAALLDRGRRGPTALHATARGLRVERPGAPTLALRWGHVAELVVARSGVLLVLEDGSRLWLPRRALGSAEQHARFVADMEERFAQELARQETPLGPHPNFPELVAGLTVEVHRSWPDAGGGARVELDVRGGTARRRLRFDGVEGLDLVTYVGTEPEEDDDEEGSPPGVTVLAVPHAELDGLGVLVVGRDAHGVAFRFLAETAVEPDAAALEA